VSIIVYLIVIALTGLIVGGLARLSLPGPDPMSIGETILLGVAGSLAAGLIGWAIWGRNAGGIVLAVLCSSVILYFIRRSRGGGLTRPGAPPGDRV
jgi:uncharacterized membrane protein YeaQ/YmgE (transglycosylase-associated protein family)